MDEWLLLGRVALAAVLGGVIGFEREAAERPAGLRTHMLVAAAAALIVVVGVEVLEQSGQGGDPNRALHGVVTGIGFLGAGTIFTSRGQVQGLTTATTLFLAAAIGLAVASDLYVLAVGVTVLVLVTLRLLHRVERRLAHKRDDSS